MTRGAVSMMYSNQMVGSVYVKATPLLPLDNASEARSSGLTYLVGTPADWDMLQFWQKSHVRLQPAGPVERISVPGMKWYRGFFSMGSMERDTHSP
jgi:hypothetical protein